MLCFPLSTVAGGPFNRSRAFRSDGALGDGRGWGVARCHASMAIGVAMQIPVTSTTPLNWFQSEFFMDSPYSALNLPALLSHVAFIHPRSAAAKHFVLAPSWRFFPSALPLLFGPRSARASRSLLNGN